MIVNSICDDINTERHQPIVKLDGYTDTDLSCYADRILRQYHDKPNGDRKVILSFSKPARRVAMTAALRHSTDLYYSKALRTGVAQIMDVRLDPIDCLMVNVYFRRLLRARLELDFLNIIPKLSYKSHEINESFVPSEEKFIFVAEPDFFLDNQTLLIILRYLRLICQVLGLQSLHDCSPFPKSLLANAPFWINISNKVVNSIGQTHCINSDLLYPANLSEEGVQAKYDGMIISETTIFLNDLIRMWSGAELRDLPKDPDSSEEMVCIIQPRYVDRLVSHVKPFEIIRDIQ